MDKEHKDRLEEKLVDANEIKKIDSLGQNKACLSEFFTILSCKRSEARQGRK